MTALPQIVTGYPSSLRERWERVRHLHEKIFLGLDRHEPPLHRGASYPYPNLHKHCYPFATKLVRCHLDSKARPRSAPSGNLLVIRSI